MRLCVHAGFLGTRERRTTFFAVRRAVCFWVEGFGLADEGAAGGELEFHARGVVGFDRPGPGGVGVELDGHAAVDDLLQEFIAGAAQAGGGALDCGLVELDFFVCLQRGF